MKTPEKINESIHRWIDGALSPAERARFETEVLGNPALRAEVEAMHQLGSLLRANVAIEKSVPHGDFFNNQIQEHIAGLQRAKERAASSGGASGWLRWLRSPWIIAGVAAVLALGAFVMFSDDDDTYTQVHHHYSPNPNVNVQSFHSDAADATVIILDGLDEMPDGKDLSNAHNDSEQAVASNTRSSGDGGNTALSII